MRTRIVAAALAVTALAATGCETVAGTLPGGRITAKAVATGGLIKISTVRGDLYTDSGKAAKCSVGESWPSCWQGS